jgi:hypothetical protein
MKKIKHLTIEQHQEMAAWLKNRPMQIYCDIINTYGRTSKAGRYCRKVINATESLKCEMDNRAHEDLGSLTAAELYYT